jgi:hypothetical protein
LWAAGDRRIDGAGKGFRVVGGEEQTVLALADEFAMAADIRREDDAAARHGFQGFSGVTVSVRRIA